MIENKFQCVGWCSTSYKMQTLIQSNNNEANATNVTDTNSKGEETQMIKYLFSNINNGIPQHFGCVDQVISWLPQYLLSNGSCTIVQAAFQIVIFVLCIKLANTKNKDNIQELEIQNVKVQ